MNTEEKFLEELRKKKSKEDYTLINLFDKIKLPYKYRHPIKIGNKKIIPKFIIFDAIIIIDDKLAEDENKVNIIKGSRDYSYLSLKNTTINNFKDLIYKLYQILTKLKEMNIPRAERVRGSLYLEYKGFFEKELIN